MCLHAIPGHSDALDILDTEVKTDFYRWLKILKNEPTVFYRGKNLTLGIPFEFSRIKWYTSPENFTGVLKFVCGPPAEVSNDNFQL